MSETQTEKRTTAAELKKQIEDAQKSEKQRKIQTDLKESGLPLVSGVANEINASSTPAESLKAESKSEPAQTPAQPATEKATVPNRESVELQEWKKKKGIAWDTPDSVALELRKLDQEFHRKKVEEKRRVDERPPVAPSWTPPPVYPNTYPSYGYQAPAYPAPPMNRQVVENLARQYNVPPDDFERIVQIQRDLTAAMLDQERKRYTEEMESVKRENIKNSEFRELAADPVFRKPEVAMEFHRVLESMQESDPDSFSQDPRAYRKVYDQALINLARRNLEGSFESTTQDFQLPKNPPKPLGQGSGGGRETNENGITQAEYNGLSVEEKRKLLDRMGLVQSKY